MTPPDPAQAPPRPQASSGRGLRIARIGGVPVYVGGGWVLIAVATVLTFGPAVARVMPGTGAVPYLVAAAYALLLLVSVLAHEAAHAVAAARCGYRVDAVVADLIGGHTTFDAGHATPGRNALVAAVGPATNGLLALAGHAWTIATPTGVVGLLAVAFTWTNAAVAVLNALPGAPLDGGHLLESAAWAATGRRHVGQLAAGWAGRIVTIGLVLWFAGRPLLRGEPPSLWTLAWVGLIGAFMWSGASQSVQAGRMRGRLAAVRPAEVLVPALTVDAAAPLADLARLQAPGRPLPGGAPAAGDPLPAPGTPHAVVVTDTDGRPLGHLDPEAAQAALDAGDAAAPVSSCTFAHPAEWVVEADPADLTTGLLVDTLQERRLPVLCLCAPGGAAYALLDAGRVAQAARATS